MVSGPGLSGAGGIWTDKDLEQFCEDGKEQRAEAALTLGPESNGKIWRARAGSCGEGLAWLGVVSHRDLGLQRAVQA